MKLHWYWPFAREEEISLADHVPRPDDRLTVQVVGRPGSPAPGTRGAIEILADLPEVRPATVGSVSWFANRVHTYALRARRRTEAIARGEPDVLHLLFVNRFTDVPLLRRHDRPPTVIDVHDVLPHRMRIPFLERRALAELYERADHIVVHHEWVRDRLIELFPRSAEASVVPLQVPPARVVPPETPWDPPMVLCFGTLRRNKGIDVLLEAVQRSTGRWRLHVAGRGDAVVEAGVRAAAQGSPRVTAELGWVHPDRKSELYRAASLVVLPYTAFESQSAVLHDAYAHACPVVVADAGALGRAVREDGSGWVVEVGDAAQLATCLDAAMADPLGRQAAATAADAVAAARHPSVVGAQVRAIYDQLDL